MFTWLLSGMNLFADDFSEQRQHMINEIQQMMDMTESFTGASSLNDHVLAAMKTVPRHYFVPTEYQTNAYDNIALPINHDQTISQPYIVALMTELAEVSSESVVLEVGTGSGYQAAILAGIVKHVYSIEIVEQLGLEAKARLQHLGYDNVTVKIGDGYYGWLEYAPFDAILVTAAAPNIPDQLIQQLKPGGRLIIPVGKRYMTQSLRVLKKATDGKINEREVLPVSFVPLTGEH